MKQEPAAGSLGIDELSKEEHDEIFQANSVVDDVRTSLLKTAKFELGNLKWRSASWVTFGKRGNRRKLGGNTANNLIFRKATIRLGHERRFLTTRVCVLEPESGPRNT